MEEDMERLRARRRATHSARGRNAVPHSPADSTFSSDSAGSSVILGLGTGSGIRDVLPLKSRFFDWCCEYFKEPQMRVSDLYNFCSELNLYCLHSKPKLMSREAWSTTIKPGANSATSKFFLRL